MNRVFYLVILVLLITSCSEGDIIETNVNFDATLENCANLEENTFVFYKIDPSVNQSLSLGFTSTTFELNTVPEELSTTINLNGTSNTLFYRKFASAINGADYFCSSVPPNGITVTEELTATDGTAQITYTIENETNTQIIYNRVIILNNITFVGDIIIRREILDLGMDQVTITK